MIKVCLLGCGAIGQTIAENSGKKYRLIAVFDKNVNKAEEVAKISSAEVAKSFDDFLNYCKNCDVAVEAASQQAVRDCVRILEFTDLVIMSVGALRDAELLNKLISTARASGRKIHIPSGAVGGIDALKAVKGLAEEVTLTSVKHPESLKDSYFFKEKRIKVENIKERTVLFDGNAMEAVKFFPANVNVAATVSLACLGFKRTRVRIIADPGVRENYHEIRAKGSFGELCIVAKNKKHPKNPKTSYLAALSVVRLLREMAEEMRVGT